jgi:hypothetical protein
VTIYGLVETMAKGLDIQRGYERVARK